MAQLNLISNSIKKDFESLSETTSLVSLNTRPIYEEKKRILLQALNLKKNGQAKEYYTLINQQSFVRAKEEPVALKIWVKVFLDSMSLIIHEYKDYELLELILFKLPWFSPQSTHSRYFRYFQSLIFALFPHDPSYLNKVVSHAFSPFGFFQCILNGEVRSSLSEVLWERTAQILMGRNDFSDEETANLKLNYKVLKSAEDIFNRAKVILKSYSDQEQASSVIGKQSKQITGKEHDLFLKALFSFSPSRNLNYNFDYPISIGFYQNVPGFVVSEDRMKEDSETQIDDFVSIKKCLLGLNQEYLKETVIFKERKFNNSPLKYMAPLLIKIMKTYPLTQQSIFKNLLERIPHKKAPIENQLIYNQVLYDVVQEFPKREKQFLLLISEKLSQIDMEIKIKPRRVYRGNFRVQDQESYLKELQTRVQDENQIKFSLLFSQLLAFLKKRILNMSDKNDHYEEDLLYLFKRKIFSLQKLNFLQYLPAFIMTLKTDRNQVAELFTKKWLSFLILTSFSPDNQENLVVRQQAWNYLIGFLSRQKSLLDQEFFLKCLQHILSKSDELTQHSEEIQSSEKLFMHSLSQGLALLISCRGEEIRQMNQVYYNQIIKLLFKKNHHSLQFCSTQVLWDLLQACEAQIELKKFKDKVKKSMNQNKENINSSKRHIYSKISRFVPYEQPMVLLGQSTFEPLFSYQQVQALEYDSEDSMKEISIQDESILSQRPKKRMEDQEELKIPKSDSILYDPKEFEFLKQTYLKQGYNSSEEFVDSEAMRDANKHRSHSSNHSEISNQETQHSVDNPFSQTFDRLKNSSPTRRSPPHPSKRINIKEQTHKVRQLNGKPIHLSQSN